jgi:hypothetical protein
MIREQELIDLGFEKSELENDDPYYYYFKDIGEVYSKLTLISNGNDKADGDNWYVEMLESDDFKFVDSHQLKTLIDTLEYALKVKVK